jgi:hypothetical protein
MKEHDGRVAAAAAQKCTRERQRADEDEKDIAG